MKIQCYLVVSWGGALSIRKSQPLLKAREVAVPLHLDIPNSLFEPRITQPVTVEVPVRHIVQPTVETFDPAALLEPSQ